MHRALADEIYKLALTHSTDDPLNVVEYIRSHVSTEHLSYQLLYDVVMNIEERELLVSKVDAEGECIGHMHITGYEIWNPEL